MSVEKVKGGYKVEGCHGKDKGKALSKKPLSKAKAEAQLRAVEAHKHGDTKFARGEMKRRDDGSYERTEES